MPHSGVDSYVLLTRPPLIGDQMSEVRYQIFDFTVEANLLSCLEIDL